LKHVLKTGTFFGLVIYREIRVKHFYPTKKNNNKNKF